jgi:RNA polymerase sigma-70 factor (ECF subfamily)
MTITLLAPSGTPFAAVPSRLVTAVTGTDDRLLRDRLVAGDERALATVVSEFGSLVRGVARKVLGDDAAAEDVTQDVFVWLWERPDRFDPERGSLRSFLTVVSRRRAIDWIRRHDADRRRADRAAQEAPLVLDDLADGVTDRDDAAKVRAAVDALPAEQRECVTLAFFGGLSYREVAVKLGIPEGTAKSRLRLALGKLSTTLQPPTPSRP